MRWRTRTAASSAGPVSSASAATPATGTACSATDSSHDPPSLPMSKRLHTLKASTDEKPLCPYGHQLPTAHRPSYDGTITCRHREPEGSECGTLCWVALLTFGGSAAVRGTGERVWIVVHVSPADVRHFTRTPMLFIEKLAYLGHTPENVLRGLEPGDSHVA
jgi:hypothetical protein